MVLFAAGYTGSPPTSVMMYTAGTKDTRSCPSRVKSLPKKDISPLHDFSGSSILPEMEVERHELEQAVQQALNRLDADQRTVVVLVDQQDFNYAEAAQVLRIPSRYGEEPPGSRSPKIAPASG